MIGAPQEIRTYFVTAVTANRRRVFQVDAAAELLVATLQGYRKDGRFALHAFVVMPDHLHLLLTPASDVSLEKAIQFIKGGFSFRFKSKMGVWERSYNEVQILSLEKFEACKRYIEYNPVRARLADSPKDFGYSSAGRQGEVDAIPGHFLKARG